jgi:hypothetical protein
MRRQIIKAEKRKAALTKAAFLFSKLVCYLPMERVELLGVLSETTVMTSPTW